jgi:hypothetical protein
MGVASCLVVEGATCRAGWLADVLMKPASLQAFVSLWQYMSCLSVLVDLTFGTFLVRYVFLILSELSFVCQNFLLLSHSFIACINVKLLSMYF